MAYNSFIPKTHFHKSATGSCSAWPQNPTFGCKKTVGSFKLLDDTYRNYDSAMCEKLCLQEEENGCCFLNDQHGCLWLSNGVSFNTGSPIGSTVGIAVTCDAGKIQNN